MSIIWLVICDDHEECQANRDDISVANGFDDSERKPDWWVLDGEGHHWCPDCARMEHPIKERDGNI